MTQPIRLALLALLLTGCATSPQDPDPQQNLTQEKVGPGSELTPGYSLLYDVLTDEAQVDGIFIIRGASDATKQAVGEIAKVAQQAKADIEAMAKNNPTVDLDAAELPDAEVAARELIADWQKKKLMFGGDFERNLLLTQAEATQYMAALAQSLSETDKNEQRAERLKKLASDMSGLHDRVVARLKPAE